MDQPELPDLKKKDKERKKAGAVFNGWGGGSGGGGLAGAAGAAGRSAAVEALEAAEVGAGRTGLAQLFARLLSTTAGRLALAACAALMIGVLLALPRLFTASSARPGEVALGGISDSLHVRRPGESVALDSLAQVARGQLKFDDGAAAAKPKEEEKPPEKQEAPATPTPPEKTDWNNVLNSERPYTDKLAHNLAGAKLSGSLGNNFGRANVFTDPNAPKFGDAMLNKLGQLNGRSASMKSTKKIASARSSRLSSRSPRAIGQLRFARQLSSRAGLASTVDQAKTAAGDAFDGQVTQGGAAPMIGSADTPATVSPPPNSPTVAPPTATPFNDTPYQNNLDQAKQQAQDAGNMKMMGMIMLALGAALMMAGMMMMNGPQAQMGMMLLIAGIGLMAAGAMMMMMAANEKQQADNNANQVQQQQGQGAQAQDAHQCIDQAYNNGGNVADNCQGNVDTGVQDHSTTVATAVNAELNSGYTVDGGKPIDSGGSSSGSGSGSTNGGLPKRNAPTSGTTAVPAH